METTITVYLHDTDNQVQSIIVHPYDSLRLLDDFITTKGKRVLFCNGSILMPAFSFSYLNINNGDHVFVVRPKESPRNQNSPSKKMDHPFGGNRKEILKRMAQSFNRDCPSLNIIKDPTIFHEASRIADIINNHRDSDILTRYYNLQQKTEEQNRTKQNKKAELSSPVILPSPPTPSSEALPLLWGAF
ncbi:hypothetical protein TRFO_23564 [Tritrichomonas foetus]|uniref:Ubiquitin-like domain-containing protein n=1 Tax=Tritrichomonas foetus TaxID=1144522 RepID=A0A1J4KEF9_9EUKA|nr:hypothetical protein TRFO_23564 [Tritrichomonas foetus]|eukprot:OHT08100.1 hypothetical protein TRFO_23564 [Tritrichomonas foetus]